jgi:hypothetical protein
MLIQHIVGCALELCSGFVGDAIVHVGNTVATRRIVWLGIQPGDGEVAQPGEPDPEGPQDNLLSTAFDIVSSLA